VPHFARSEFLDKMSKKGRTQLGPRRRRLPQQGGDLRSPVQGLVGGHAHHRGGPKHLGARIGITSVLHTWGSTMTHHPHVHMIVPGGGLAPDGSRWIPGKPNFLLPVRVLSKLFRRLMLEKLAAAHEAGQLRFFGADAHLADAKAFAAVLAPLRKKRWFVYAKRPFAGPKAVLAYLSRYTHRVAISNRRLITPNERRVTFKVKDYWIEGPSRYTTMTLDVGEFIRRFLIHVLPKGFHRIRQLFP
jgi:Putative transposase